MAPLDAFRDTVREDANALLDRRMTAEEFAGSVWYAATTFSLSLPEAERATVLSDWVRFAEADDALDDVHTGRRPPGDREKIEADLRAEAEALIRAI
jgi:hypothetical protein